MTGTIILESLIRSLLLGWDCELPGQVLMQEKGYSLSHRAVSGLARIPAMRTAALLIAVSALCASCAAIAPDQHAGHEAPPPDARQTVEFPEPLRSHTLANMRDHLATLQQIQQSLATGAFDTAAELAEQRLGMSSLRLHGAHDVAKFMPDGMQAIGTEMHRSASRFAVESANAGATGDVRKALAALSGMTQQCVACHAAYRLK
jgi:hypothetical protein